jgi:hypothetical protein
MVLNDERSKCYKQLKTEKQVTALMNKVSHGERIIQEIRRLSNSLGI